MFPLANLGGTFSHNFQNIKILLHFFPGITPTPLGEGKSTTTIGLAQVIMDFFLSLDSLFTYVVFNHFNFFHFILPRLFCNGERLGVQI
jgi:hypothetical protein